jgi:hypothetical protein
MQVETGPPVSYLIPVGDGFVPLNQNIGKSLRLEFTGNIHCIECGRKTSKSFAQGFCYPCFKSLASCDMCIMKPETCHYHLGTCREPEWGETHCMQDHIVYLANSSGLKVGITRGTQIPTRWIDQGATQAIPMFRVGNRLHSGLLEVTIKKQVSDRTDWRKLLKGEADSVDLVALRQQIFNNAEQDLEQLKQDNPELEWEFLDADPIVLSFPVETYPQKISSLNFDKNPVVEGILQGIKGQYLILDSGVINIRKFAGYEVTVPI